MNSETTRRAVILLSGGLDSITALAYALEQRFECHPLSFDYGQRHCAELNAARAIASGYGLTTHTVLPIGLSAFGGSALTDPGIEVPDHPEEGIPVTYVPARNTIFLSFALGWAEVLDARDIFIGVNAVDYSGYPDCRPEFITAYQQMANLATRAGIEGEEIRINTPLIDLSKEEIIRLGTDLNVDYSMTVSCYAADSHGRACNRCESCRLRREGFAAAGIADPTRYRS